jgi:predicted secreted Zn-dependent protease
VTNNELIYESNRVLQITTHLKSLSIKSDCSSVKEEAEDATQEVLSKLWSKMIALQFGQCRSFCHDHD